MNQQKQLDDWCAQKKSTENEHTEREAEREAENLDVDNTQTIEVEQLICACTLSWFPPGLEIRENLEKWEGIFQSGNFVKTGKVREKSGNFTQNTGKIRKNSTGKLKRILEKSGKFVSQ